MQARGSTLALKPRADVTRNPKQGYQWPHNKGLMPFKKRRTLVLQSISVDSTQYDERQLGSIDRLYDLEMKVVVQWNDVKGYTGLQILTQLEMHHPIKLSFGVRFNECSSAKKWL